MVVTYGAQGKDEQLSEKSEADSSRSENPARIEDIFEWIDGIPLSKTTKNLARDFSDAVLMSEILKFYYPQFVSSHNYIPANSTANKKGNWITLNRKVLSKIDMQLSSETIEQLAHSTPGVIEKVLNDFRDRQMSINAKEVSGVDVDDLPTNSEAINNLSKTKLRAVPSVQGVEESRNRSIFGKLYSGTKYFVVANVQFLLAILCFWRWFAKKPEQPSVQIMEKHEEILQHPDDDEQLREAYGQVLEELRVKADVIKTLCHKIAFLEGTMKLKDMKIASLTNQLEQSQMPEPITSARINAAAPSNLPKMRRRPKTQV